MPTFRGLATYADGTPGATDRLLFETSDNLPRGVAPQNLPTLGKATIITGVSGSLTTATHSGAVLVLSGNVTVPNAAGDVGFNATLIAGGAHTVTFNSTTSPAMASGGLMTVIVQSTTVIKAAYTAPGDLVVFT